MVIADIFISYAKADRPRVEPLAKALEEQGWSVWWDPRIRGGQHFDRVIEEALSNARCIVVIWSHKSVDSNWVRAEAAEGLEREILVPVIIEQGVKLPIQFRYIHKDELIDWDSKKPSMDFIKLLEDIKEIIDTPSFVTGSAKSKKASRAKELPKEFSNSIGMKLLLIPAGNFMMGSKLGPEEIAQIHGAEASWFEGAHPQYKVTISQPSYLRKKGSDLWN
jgi:formylglycine-generating enzyme required for sulfatase activity